MTQPEQDPAGRTPSAPDVDKPEGGTGDDGRTPSAPDQAEGDDRG